MPENLQRSATVRKFHAYERSESPGYENRGRTKYSGFTACLFIAGSTNCVQLGVACGWLRYGLKCKLLIDVLGFTNNYM